MIVEPGNSYEERTVLSQEWTAAMEKILLQPNEHQQSTFGSATLAVRMGNNQNQKKDDRRQSKNG